MFGKPSRHYLQLNGFTAMQRLLRAAHTNIIPLKLVIRFHQPQRFYTLSYRKPFVTTTHGMRYYDVKKTSLAACSTMQNDFSYHALYRCRYFESIAEDEIFAPSQELAERVQSLYCVLIYFVYETKQSQARRCEQWLVFINHITSVLRLALSICVTNLI
jgi:hypothetical protein